MPKVQDQDDEVPRSGIKCCSGWRELCDVSGLVEVALQSLGTSTQTLIRTRLWFDHISGFATESVIKHVVSPKVHHCHDISKQVCENHASQHEPGVAFRIFRGSQRPQIFKYFPGRHCIFLDLVVDKCWRWTRGKIAALYDAL